MKHQKRTEGLPVVILPNPPRNRSVLFEKHYDELKVSEILKSVYDGEAFAGLENINLSFKHLETIIKTNKSDWKAALENLKGIYQIADKKNGKNYIGSAYGDSGIWSRWSEYVHSGYGYHSEGLRGIIQENDFEYARENFQFTLLEYWSMRTDNNFIIQRETFWKDALLSRDDFGYNRN